MALNTRLVSVPPLRVIAVYIPPSRSAGAWCHTLKVLEMRVDLRRRNDKARRKIKASKLKRNRIKGTATSRSNRQRKLSILREEDTQDGLRLKEKSREQMIRNEQRTVKNKNDLEIVKSRERVEEADRQKDRCLVLRDSNLLEVPVGIYTGRTAQQRLSSVIKLDLSQNLLTHLAGKDLTFHLSSLRVLSLSRNRLRQISDIDALVNLEILEADNNELESLPRLPSSLKHLNASQNKLEHFPESIGDLPSLLSLVAASNNLTDLPLMIGQLKNLELLDLSMNKLTNLPETFSHLSNLVKADLSENALNDLPTQLPQCLQILELSLNLLQVVPSSASQLESLLILRIDHNLLQDFPDCSGGCKNVLEISCGSNNIECVSACVGKLSSIQRFHMPSNRVRFIPKEIGMLTSCIELNLRSNILTSLPEEMGAMKSLVTVDLAHNELPGLPPSICLLVAIESLNISNNMLKSLPESFGALRCLAFLNASYNDLTEFPQSFKHLTNLKVLLASSNKVTQLSAGVINDTNLCQIDLSTNRLAMLPLVFVDIRHICDMDVSHNPFQDLLPNWRRRWSGEEKYMLKETRSILDWLQEEATFFKYAAEEWTVQQQSNHGNPNLIQFGDGIMVRLSAHGHVSMEEGSQWKEFYLPLLTRMFTECKNNGGLLPSYDNLKAIELRERERAIRCTKANRMENADKAKENDLFERERRDTVYFLDLHHQTRVASKRIYSRAEEKKEAEREELKRLVSERLCIQNEVAARSKEKREHNYRLEVKKLISLVGKVDVKEPTKCKRTLPIELSPCWRTKTDIH